MSRLSKLFHENKGAAFREAIQYLETVDIPNEAKQAAAVAVVKALHVPQDGPWDEELQRGVIYCIDYVLGDIRSWAAKKDAPATAVPATPPSGPGPAASVYGVLYSTPIPDDSVLTANGYKDGDCLYPYVGNKYYSVVPKGSVPPMQDPEGNRVLDVPHIIGH